MKDILNTCPIKNPPKDYLKEEFKLCLCNTNSLFSIENLLQTIVTATSAPNLWSYPDITVASLNHTIMDQMETTGGLC